MKYSSSKEDYLKAIYHLQAQEGVVSTNELAGELQTRAASVTDMLKKLKGQKLLNYEPYKGFRLSSEGKKVAVQVVRKHRLWEYFLVEKLHFEWDEVHEIAEELEHISSRKLIDRLDEYLGFPKTDPHGDPIPDSSGKLERAQQIPLMDLPLHIQAQVSGIGDQSTDMLEMLRHKNIKLGAWIEIRKKFNYDGSLELKIKNAAAVTVSGQVAKNIFVQHEKQGE
jgi:DtxR family transcriptional regulator, Mn-dependent transcriptional regulator